MKRATLLESIGNLPEGLREQCEKAYSECDPTQPIGIPNLRVYSQDQKVIGTADLIKAGIGRRYHNITFDYIEKKGVPNHLKPQYEQVKEYVRRIDHFAHYGQGVILRGKTGTLKTTLAIAILRHWLELGNRGMIVTMSGLIDQLNVLKTKNKQEWANYESQLKNIGLLVLDDLGAEDTTPWDLAKVDAIISERYNRGNPIIVTTNLRAEELKEKYSDRIYDRLRSTAVFSPVMTGESLR